METKLNIVLFQPQIPQNTGSIARLCACVDARLHLVHPLGFQLDEKSVKRAGLDYWDHLDVVEHESFRKFLESEKPEQLHLFSKFSKKPYYQARFKLPCYLVFGSETTGLPVAIRKEYEKTMWGLPMRVNLVRSLNLAQTVAVATYEVIGQNFKVYQTEIMAEANYEALNRAERLDSHFRELSR